MIENLTVVLADANILYGRVTRDFILEAQINGYIQVRWSERIIDEFTRALACHGKKDAGGILRLTEAMNRYFPDANVVPTEASHQAAGLFNMPDEDDRHVVAAALEVHASFICTGNLRDFPNAQLSRFGIEAVSLDTLASLISERYGNIAITKISQNMIADRGAGYTLEELCRQLAAAGAEKTAAHVRRVVSG
ncbi:MAG: PIN domain-containing protein [Ancrocorticia sp.]|uniref:PIN domain-containing protein n=1 Tax=Ancrocorticia sp. TaxID=2593684 RepID=UPI003F8DDA16